MDRAAAFHLLVLSAVSFALYARTLWNGFAADDEFEVLKDPQIRSFANIPALFAHGVWFFAGAKAGNYYRPLKLLAYSVEYHLFHFRPAFWHLVNVLLNLAVVFAIYFLVRDLAARLRAHESTSGPNQAALAGQPASAEGAAENSTYAEATAGKLAFWSALFFAFHPIHVEAVAWIAVGNDLLCGLALLMALWFYHRVRTPGGAPRAVLLYAGSVALFFAGLLFKETALTFPAVILSYDYFYRGESLRAMLRGWRRYLAYLAALGFYLALRIHALRGFAPRTNPLNMTVKDLALSVPVLAAQYLWKLVVPVNLNFWYVYKPVRALGWEPVASIALVFALVLGMFWLRPVPGGRGLRPGVGTQQGIFRSGQGRQPILSFALAWFWLTLIPSLDIPQVGTNVFTERYLYIPSFSFCIFAAWVWLNLRGLTEVKAASGRPATGGRLAYACLVALFAFYAAVLLRRIPYWHDDLRLWTRTAQQAPNAAPIQSDLGVLYKSMGRFPEAVAYAQRAVALDPANPRFHNNLASVLLASGRGDEALREVERAIQIQPNDPDYWANLALVYQARMDWGKTVESCQRGLALDPNDRALLDTLGLALWRSGDREEALAAYRRAIQAEPDNLNAYVNLASSLVQLGQLDAAADQLVAGLRADPDSPDAYLGHYELGVIYRDKGFWQQAAAEFQRAMETKPDFGPARAQLEAARAHLARPQP